MTETEKLAKAALAVCDRWDTPDWSDHRHTADFIRDLREALTAWNTRPDEGEPVAWRWRKRGADVPWIVGSARIEGEGVDGFYEIQPLYTRPAQAAAEITRLASRIEELERALIKLRDCDWVITPLDRMDAVREIARQALSDKG
jgi:hypothetical protein